MSACSMTKHNPDMLCLMHKSANKDRLDTLHDIARVIFVQQ